MREAVFSGLSSARDLRELQVLDLFAGSGSWGFEALSRGCNFAVFVEKERELTELLKFNLEKLKLSSSARVIRGVIPQVLYSNFAEKIPEKRK